MPLATPAAVRKQIESGRVDPIYLLQGEDDVEKSALAAEFGELVDEELRAFNVERIQAGDLTTADKLADGVASLVAAVRTLPMMSPRRVVIVLQADTLLVPKRESEAATRALDQLETIVKEADPRTTLVLVAGSVDKRSRMYKLLVKHATLVESELIEDRADAERWIRTRVAAAGAEIDPAAARLLAERGGTDVKRLRGDVERLLLYALGQKSVTIEDVRQIVGPAGVVGELGITHALQTGGGGGAVGAASLVLRCRGAPRENF